MLNCYSVGRGTGWLSPFHLKTICFKTKTSAVPELEHRHSFLAICSTPYALTSLSFIVNLPCHTYFRVLFSLLARLTAMTLMHNFVKYFPSLISSHSSKTVLWQSKPKFCLQHKACSQVLIHWMSSFLLKSFQFGPSHSYFTPELCSHSRNTLGIIIGAHIKEQQRVILQRQDKLDSPSATYCICPLANKKPPETSGQVNRLVLTIPKRGSLLKVSQVFSPPWKKNDLSTAPSDEFPNASFCPHHFPGDSTCSEDKVCRWSRNLFSIARSHQLPAFPTLTASLCYLLGHDLHLSCLPCSV